VQIQPGNRDIMDAEIMLETGVATLVAVLGGAIAVAAAGDEAATHRRRLLALVSLAAGALLAVTLVSILPEAREHLSLLGLVTAAISGYGLYYLIGRYLFPICPACASDTFHKDPGHVHTESCSHDHDDHGQDAHPATQAHSSHKPITNFRNIATLLGVVVAAHAAVDGIAIASGQHGHVSADSGALTSMAEALPLLFALSLHKLPEGLALTALLISSGFRRTQAFLLTAGIELATLLGGALGVMLRDIASPALLSGIMAHVGGGFLYLAFQALKSDNDEPSQGRATVIPPQIAYGGIGFVSVSLILWTINFLSSTH
jgi:zinc transporter ZupT